MSGYTWEKHEKDGSMSWFLRGPEGVAHVTVTRVPDGMKTSCPYYGGIEFHRAPRPSDDPEKICTECWVRGGPCVTEGSTLFMQEIILPVLGQEERVRSRILAAYRTYFNTDKR